MDIKCHVCGEPWDVDYLHDVIEERFPSQPWRREDGSIDETEYHRIWSNLYADFRLVGCNAFNEKHNYNPDFKNSEALATLADAFGDDIDGYASMIEDFDL